MTIEETVYLCLLSALAGGLFIHFFGCYRGRVRQLVKSLKDLSDRYAVKAAAYDAAKIEWSGKEVVLRETNTMQARKMDEINNMLTSTQGDLGAAEAKLFFYARNCSNLHLLVQELTQYKLGWEDRILDTAKELLYISKVLNDLDKKKIKEDDGIRVN